MQHIKVGVIFLILNNLIVLGLNAQYTQEKPLPFDKHESSVGISVGNFLFLFIDLEISWVNYHRVSNSTIIQYKPFLAGIKRLNLYQGNESPDYTVYGGGAVGVLVGNKSKFFELDIGGAYLFRGLILYQGKDYPLIFVGNVAYRNEGVGVPFNIGLGIPKGLFVTLYF